MVDLLVHAKTKNILGAFRQLQALLQPLAQLQDVHVAIADADTVIIGTAIEMAR